MTITVRATKQLGCDLHSHIKPAVLGLILLAGCSTSNVTPLTDPNTRGTACNSDGDTFCMENDSQKAARLNQQGLEFAAKQDFGRAAELLEQATILDRSNAEYLYNLGVAYSFMGQVAKEEAAYMAALEIKLSSSNNPKLDRVWGNIYFNLACLYALQGKKEQAFEQLDNLATVGATDMFHSVQDDKDLDSLRVDPRFKPALDKIANSRKSPQPTEPSAQ